MRGRPHTMIVAAAILMVFVSMNCRDKPNVESSKVILRVPDTRFMGILPLYVADEKGFFNQQGIKIEWIDVKDPGQAQKLFHAGHADFIMTTFANLLPAEVRKSGTLKLLFPIYESAEKPGSFILTTPDSQIRSVQDLRGKTLGTYSGPSQKAYALIVLSKLGLREPEDVRLVQVASSAQVQGLFGGTYDALFTVETYASTAISKGARIVESGVRTKYISNPFWLGSAAVHAKFTIQNPKAITELLTALEKAAEYIEKHESEAREILSRRTRTEMEVAQRCALYTWVAHPTQRDVEQIQDHVNLLVSGNLLIHSVVIESLLEGTIDGK